MIPQVFLKKAAILIKFSNEESRSLRPSKSILQLYESTPNAAKKPEQYVTPKVQKRGLKCM
jgi:hypothetical protein